MEVGGWGELGEIDGIRGKEGLAVSQLDLLILQPWGKGVCECVCVSECVCIVFVS